MGGLLAVNLGSITEPTFIIMEYKSPDAQNDKPLVLVGKGVMYDTGGLSLKPTGNSMDYMKCDMAGSAAVVGGIAALAKAKLPIHVIGLIPAVENRPGGDAFVPGDIITQYDGTTVEVLNTDAEGRLILADALAYAKQYDPGLVLDFATLTGAAARAIGQTGTVFMGTAEKACRRMVKKVGKKTGERMVKFPLWEEHGEMMDSEIADLKNLGGEFAGASSAGKFLQHFTDYPWLHFDIAGPAFLKSANHYRPAGGTGVGVRFIYTFAKQWLKHVAEERED
jgi:leucyl aminopeptidase